MVSSKELPQGHVEDGGGCEPMRQRYLSLFLWMQCRVIKFKLLYCRLSDSRHLSIDDTISLLDRDLPLCHYQIHLLMCNLITISLWSSITSSTMTILI